MFACYNNFNSNENFPKGRRRIVKVLRFVLCRENSFVILKKCEKKGEPSR